MKPVTKHITLVAGVATLFLGALALPNQAADKTPMQKFMQACHKAPEGVDPVCKKASNGLASKEEIKQLLAGYQAMSTDKPPRGDEASWKEKTAALVKAVEGLDKGLPNAAMQYKDAVNCKACHSVHKPESKPSK